MFLESQWLRWWIQLGQEVSIYIYIYLYVCQMTCFVLLDCFCGALAFFLSSNWNVLDSAKAANIVAAESVKKTGKKRL